MELHKILLLVALFTLLIVVPLAVHDMREARLYRLSREAHSRPYSDREFHELFAKRHGYFWKPCPSCGNSFGGHEVTGKSVPHPDPDKAAKGCRVPICPPCSLQLRPPSSNTAKKAFGQTRT